MSKRVFFKICELEVVNTNPVFGDTVKVVFSLYGEDSQGNEIAFRDWIYGSLCEELRMEYRVMHLEEEELDGEIEAAIFDEFVAFLEESNSGAFVEDNQCVSFAFSNPEAFLETILENPSFEFPYISSNEMCQIRSVLDEYSCGMLHIQ